MAKSGFSVDNPGVKHRRRGRTRAAAESLTIKESFDDASNAAHSLVHSSGLNEEDERQERASSPEALKPGISDIGETFPLSGNPFFASIIIKSNVQSKYQMGIPKSFWSFLPAKCVRSILCHQNKTWEMQYYGDRSFRRFDQGWKHFAIDTNLKIGDAIVLELVDDKDLKFQVQILRGELPCKSFDCGLSHDYPILID